MFSDPKDFLLALSSLFPLLWFVATVLYFKSYPKTGLYYPVSEWRLAWPSDPWSWFRSAMFGYCMYVSVRHIIATVAVSYQTSAGLTACLLEILLWNNFYNPYLLKIASALDPNNPWSWIWTVVASGCKCVFWETCIRTTGALANAIPGWIQKAKEWWKKYQEEKAAKAEAAAAAAKEQEEAAAAAAKEQEEAAAAAAAAKKQEEAAAAAAAAKKQEEAAAAAAVAKEQEEAAAAKQRKDAQAEADKKAKEAWNHYKKADRQREAKERQEMEQVNKHATSVEHLSPDEMRKRCGFTLRPVPKAPGRVAGAVSPQIPPGGGHHAVSPQIPPSAGGEHPLASPQIPPSAGGGHHPVSPKRSTRPQQAATAKKMRKVTNEEEEEERLVWAWWHKTQNAIYVCGVVVNPEDKTYTLGCPYVFDDNDGVLVAKLRWVSPDVVTKMEDTKAQRHETLTKKEFDKLVEQRLLVSIPLSELGSSWLASRPSSQHAEAVKQLQEMADQLIREYRIMLKKAKS